MLRSRRLAGTCAGVAVALLATLLPAAVAQATPAPTPASYFGVHDGGAGLTSWAKAPVGSLRLWDTGTIWRDLQPSAGGPWQVSRLDQLVKASVVHKADPVIVLGGTPAWASTRSPAGSGAPAPFNGAGSADPPKAAAWAAYVKFIVSRYKSRGVHHYQVWNEPNVIGFWNGSPAQMAALTATTAKIIKSVDRSAKVVGPSFVLRLPDAQRWFTAYVQTAAKTKALANVDALTVQPYPLANQGPEQSIVLIGWAKSVLAKYKVVKPLWNSEINYGMSGGRQPHRTLSAADGAAYVARTYLLNKTIGVSRVYWYNWAANPILGIQMETPSGANTAAAAAFTTTRRWMVGQVLNGCTRDKRGTYRCQITTSKTVGYVYWNPTTYRPIVSAPARTYQLEYLNGTVHKAAKGTKLKVGQAPILIRVKR